MKKKKNKKCKLYTDGGCKPNPGFGAWAAIIIQSSKVTRHSGFEANTTNNRMELKAVIKGLIQLIDQAKLLQIVIEVGIHSDSSYVVQGVNHPSRLEKWRQNGFYTSYGAPLKNRDLWLELNEILESPFIKFKFIKVKGHSDDKWNNECDELASLEIQLNRLY